jgi:hypothetical protein
VDFPENSSMNVIQGYFSGNTFPGPGQPVLVNSDLRQAARGSSWFLKNVGERLIMKRRA